METGNIDEICKKFGLKREDTEKELQESAREILKFILAESQIFSHLPKQILLIIPALFMASIYEFLRSVKEAIPHNDFESLINNFKENIDNMKEYLLYTKQHA